MNKEQYKNQLLDIWKKTKLLKDVPEDRQGEAVCLMENQRIMNGESNDEFFNRLSVPMTRNFMANFIGFDTGSVQTLYGPNDKYLTYERNKLVEVPCVPQSHKLKAVWAIEAAQDLKSVNGIDAEFELMTIISQEVTLELNRDVMTKLRGACATYGTSTAYECDFVSDIFKLSKEIGEVCKRGNANWLITSPEIVDKLCLGRKDTWDYSLGVDRVHSLSDGENTIKVYRDPLFPMNQMLMGFKGEEPYNAGYVFCPYIFLQKLPVVLDPDSFAPRRPLMSRYYFKVTDPRCFGRLSFTNLQFLN